MLRYPELKNMPAAEADVLANLLREVYNMCSDDDAVRVARIIDGLQGCGLCI